MRCFFIKKIIKAFKSFVGSIINEFFILLGVSTVVYATYRISLTASIYMVGVLFIFFGLFLAWTRRE